MKNVITGNPIPQAFITKNKHRVKQFVDSVYLKDGDNFEIELFNPKSIKVLAKISLNGNFISHTGIILRPGERVFLERYIDTNNKFVFNTYEVNGNNKEVLNAIKQNGALRVEFYDEQTPIHWAYPSGNNLWFSGTTSGNVANFTYDGTCTCYYTNTSSTDCNTASSNFAQYSASIPVFNTASSNISTSNSKKIETGTVEKGEKSKQTFDYSYETFNTISTVTIFWQILPESRKPISSTDLKVFCTNCGTRKRKLTHKFCPNCGFKYE